MFGGIPFGFGGGGGFPGGMGGMGGPDKEVDTTSLYEALGVEKTATKGEIRKAYMKLAKKEHPDKGGDIEKFKLISKAYEILGDEEKRKLYDDHGEEGVEHGGGGGADDIMSAMFGGGRGRGGRRGPRKGEDIVHALKVSLEDLYNGRTFKLKVTRDVVCSVCTGSGCKADGKEVECSDCDGRGFTVRVERMGPMIQQFQAPCRSCSQRGKYIEEADRCGSCEGKKVAQEKKLLEVAIEKGMKHGQKIFFRGQADEAPGVQPGDVVFVVQEKEHERFKRKGCDLILEKDISLLEALTGVRFLVEHLDKRNICVSSAAGEVIASDDLKAVVGGGMPIHGNPFEKGDLFIKFNVKFPKSGDLSAANLTALRAALPGPLEPVPAIDEDVEEISITEIDVEAVKARQRSAADAYDSDEEGGHPRGQRMQCAQQ